MYEVLPSKIIPGNEVFMIDADAMNITNGCLVFYRDGKLIKTIAHGAWITATRIEERETE